MAQAAAPGQRGPKRSPPSAAASWLLLPPGAAQVSSTRIPGRTPSRGAALEAEGSCE